MIASIVAIAMLGQVRPDTILDDRMHDAMFYRRVIEAKKQADHWAFEEPYRMFSQKVLRRLSLANPEQFCKMRALRDRAEPIFREAAYKQICVAYDISMKEFRMIIANRDVARLRHDHEKFRNGNGQRIQMATNFGGLEPTRFDPAKVKLPRPYDQISGRTHQATKPTTPKVFSDEAESRGAGKAD